QRSLSTDPNERDRPLFFAIPPPPRTPREEHAGVNYAAVMAAVREQYGASQMVAGALRKLVRSVRAGDHDFVSPRQAPKCVLNARISQSRRFATQRISIERLKAVARTAGGTVNDVVLALS